AIVNYKAHFFPFKMFFTLFLMEVKKDQQKPLPRKAKRETVKVQKVWLGSYIIVAVVCLAVYFLITLHVFDVIGKYRDILQKLTLSVFFGIVVLSANKLFEMIITRRSHTKSVRYNLIRLIRLLSMLAVAFIVISFLFANWYAAVVSLGLISLILGFALQTPIS